MQIFVKSIERFSSPVYFVPPCTCNYYVYVSVCHHIFPKVMLEVAIFCIVLLNIYFSTYVPIFIEICLYLTDTELKNTLACFCRHCVWLHVDCSQHSH